MSAARCPACEGTCCDVVREVRSAEAAQHFVLAEADLERHRALERRIRALWGGDACRVVRCGGCGFFHADPYVAGDAEFYRLAFDRRGYPRGRWEFRVTREVLASAPDRPRTLLEIGAGDGGFLRTVVPSLFRPEDALATEFSEYGRRAIDALGVRCLGVDLRDLPARLDGRFDVLCLFQVLEHLDRPDEALSRLGRLARGRARLFAAVPNDRKIAFNEAHGALLDMPPNHLGRFTREALRIAGARNGWRLVEHRVEEEPWLPMARRFLAYRHLRASQRSGSAPNRIRALPASAARAALDAAWIALTLPLALPALARLRREAGGDSQWVRFERESRCDPDPEAPRP